MSASDTKVIKDLLEAGVHFGHQTNRWNPKMKKYIFDSKAGIYIIDLEKTKDLLDKARQFLRDVARAGSYVLFVGTKKQAQDIVKTQAEKSGMFYVNQRWLGGTLTNFATIRKSIKKLKKLEQGRVDGTYGKISKKEKAQREKEIEKLMKNLAGIKEMDRLPGAVFVVDSKKEEIAVREARKLSIPVVALVDTNCDPDLIDYVIPGNDDALKSIALVTSFLTESIMDGRNQFIIGSRDKAEDRKAGDETEEKEDDKVTYELEEGDISLKDTGKDAVKTKKKKTKPASQRDK
ncbi:MAG: 30S ribosomal protein S2 [Candidatus Omnitrophota bacterium]